MVVGESHVVRIPVCSAFLDALINEVISPLNRHGTQRTCSVADPTLSQMTYHYVASGAFQEFLGKHPLQADVFPAQSDAKQPPAN